MARKTSSPPGLRTGFRTDMMRVRTCDRAFLMHNAAGSRAADIIKSDFRQNLVMFLQANDCDDDIPGTRAMIARLGRAADKGHSGDGSRIHTVIHRL